MSKYKVDDKVVMEILDFDRDLVAVGSNKYARWLGTDVLERGAESLGDYTEPLEAKIRRQAAEITRLQRDNKELKEESKRNYTINVEMARAEGQNEAWELARKCMLMTDREREAIFGSGHNALYGVLPYFDYKHAAAKVAEWEKAKEEIKVGDVYRSEVGNYFTIRTTDGEKGVAKILFMSNGEVTPDYIKSHCTKTGRHIDIDGFLKQIGEEGDEK